MKESGSSLAEFIARTNNPTIGERVERLEHVLEGKVPTLRGGRKACPDEFLTEIKAEKRQLEELRATLKLLNRGATAALLRTWEEILGASCRLRLDPRPACLNRRVLSACRLVRTGGNHLDNKQPSTSPVT